tara:strand:+ start:484 stop:1311 length:828 start_codon:yes stop_codon:yes gene_type:complete
MKYIALLPFLLINPLDTFKVDSDYAADRCVSTDCTCSVKLPKMDPIEKTTRVRKSSSIFFEEGGDTVSQSQRDRIEKFLVENPGQKRFTVVGYTDGCGTQGYNYSLSRTRARKVAAIIKRERSGSTVTIMGMSELSPTHDPAHRKVDIVVGSNVSVAHAYPDIKADVYLIDASGSMAGKLDSWLRAISSSRPPGSKIYISYTPYCYNGQDVTKLTPGGATEIWYSYWVVLDKMSRGQTLAIISDFQSRVPLTSKEKSLIDAKVARKGVRVQAFIP